MHTKKLVAGALVLSAVLGGSYMYGQGSDLQGKFSGGSIKTTPVVSTDSSSGGLDGSISAGSSLSSMPYITIDYTSDTNGTFSRKSNATAKVGLGNFDLTVSKAASSLKNCTFQLGAYNNGTMYSTVYDSSTDPNPSFVKNVTSAVKLGGSSVTTLSPTDTKYSSFTSDFSSFSSSYAPAAGSIYNYKFSGNIDTNTQIAGATAGDTANYSANTAYIYLTEVSCAYQGSTGWSYYTWDSTDSEGQNSNFDVGSYDSGKGMLLTHVVIGN